MKKFLQHRRNQREEVFRLTAEEKGVTEALIEKDFWVCLILQLIFQADALKDKILFKGGTSLSKVYNLINRFSEDIDIILDWNELGISDEEAWADRSATQQDKFNEKIDSLACEYIKNVFTPILNEQINTVLQENISLQVEDHNIKIIYPSFFASDYLLPFVLLEIGPRASRVPSQDASLTSYVAQHFPDFFESPVAQVKSILPERTFWEKITILHQIAYMREEKELPIRYSRHYYDVFNILNSSVKETAVNNHTLLKQVVEFKSKFYRSPSARYDLAKAGTLKLVPSEKMVKELSADYEKMKEMIFGETPSFNDIMHTLKEFEVEINRLV